MDKIKYVPNGTHGALQKKMLKPLNLHLVRPSLPVRCCRICSMDNTTPSDLALHKGLEELTCSYRPSAVDCSVFLIILVTVYSPPVRPVYMITIWPSPHRPKLFEDCFLFLLIFHFLNRFSELHLGWGIGQGRWLQSLANQRRLLSSTPDCTGCCFGRSHYHLSDLCTCDFCHGMWLNCGSSGMKENRQGGTYWERNIQVLWLCGLLLLECSKTCICMQSSNSQNAIEPGSISLLSVPLTSLKWFHVFDEMPCSMSSCGKAAVSPGPPSRSGSATLVLSPWYSVPCDPPALTLTQEYLACLCI